MSDNFEKIKILYRNALSEHGDSPASLFWPKGRQEDRFRALLTPALGLDARSLSLCDFGCGLAHMQVYIQKAGIDKFDYTGFEVVPEMVTNALSLGRNVKQIEFEGVLDKKYDCVVSSGAFNMMFFENRLENQDYVLDRISMLLSHCRKYFSCDFMRPDVDFQQDGAWHQSYDILFQHLSKFSRDIEVNMRILPYEYSVAVRLDT